MLENFSWVLPQQLAVGPFPHNPHDVSFLSRVGVTAILCLTKERERPVDRDILNRFVWERVPIPDGAKGGVPTVAQFEAALAVLDRWHARGHATYVHCLAGIGRSPSVCAAYLARTNDWELERAISFVQERHASARPDPHQIRVMRQFLAAGPGQVTPNEPGRWQSLQAWSARPLQLGAAVWNRWLEKH